MDTRRSDHHTWRKFKSALASTTAFVSAVLVITPLALVFFHLLINGASSLNWDFFTKLPAPVGAVGGGMANAIVGSLELLALAGAIGIPVGVLGGVYLAEYGSARINSVLRFLADVLNGVPSITWGVVVYGLVVLRFKGFSGIRRRSRVGSHHDSLDPAHNGRSYSSCAKWLSRSRARTWR